MTDGGYVAIHYGAGTPPSFYRLDGAELLETPDAHPDGTPDWDGAGVVDVGRFAGTAELSHATRVLCRALRDYLEHV